MPENGPDTESPPDACALCGRAGMPLTRHRLIPRMQHRRKPTRRRHAAGELEQVLWVCRACHDQLHAVLTERELAADFRTREHLLAHPDIGRFVRWIGTRPAGYLPPSRRTRRLRRR